MANPFDSSIVNTLRKPKKEKKKKNICLEKTKRQNRL